MSTDNYEQIELIFLAATDRAIKVCHGAHGEDFWIPRSVLFGPDDSRVHTWAVGNEVSMEVRAWFLEKKRGEGVI